MKARHAVRRRERGASYMEVLIAAVLLTASLLPMMDVLQTASSATGIHEELAVQRFHMAARMEEVLAEPFAALDAAAIAAGDKNTPTSYSDAPGVSNRRLVFLSLYDVDDADSNGDPFTGGEPDLMWVRIEIEGTVHALESLRLQ